MRIATLLKTMLITVALIVSKQSISHAIKGMDAQIVRTSLCDVNVEVSQNHPLFIQLATTTQRIMQQAPINNFNAVLDQETLHLIRTIENHLAIDASIHSKRVSLYEEILTHYQNRISEGNFNLEEIRSAIRGLANHYVRECIPLHGLRHLHSEYRIPEDLVFPLYPTDRLVTRPNGILFIRCNRGEPIRVRDDEVSVEAFCQL